MRPGACQLSGLPLESLCSGPAGIWQQGRGVPMAPSGKGHTGDPGKMKTPGRTLGLHLGSSGPHRWVVLAPRSPHPAQGLPVSPSPVLVGDGEMVATQQCSPQSLPCLSMG